MSSTLYFLMGPTAVGKTALSLEWAEKMDAEIISCDSLLFYRGMDIGTAKPTQEERARVQHHLIDIVDVDTPLNLLQYLEQVEPIVAEIESRGKNILFVGGSGFYLYSFFQPYPQDLPGADEIRSELEEQLEEEGLEALLKELESRHPEGIEALDLKNPRRVLNALLRSRILGKPWNEIREEWQGRPHPLPDYEKYLLCLGRPDDEMFPRIEKRVETMLNEGLIEEVHRLREKGILKNPPARTSIGYREILENPQASLEEIYELICLHTRQLVRKQEKWFRNQFKGISVKHPQDCLRAEIPFPHFQPFTSSV